jgi:transposase-like protein
LTSLPPLCLKGSITAGSHLLTDGFAGYRGRDAALGEYLKHTPVVQDDGANAGAFFPIIHTLFSNIKAWLLGTHHGVSAKHLPRYLREWCYRFNRRNLPDGLDGYLIRRAVECATITYDQLKAGTLPEGAKRIRRLPAPVAQPGLAGQGDCPKHCVWFIVFSGRLEQVIITSDDMICRNEILRFRCIQK